MTISIFEVEVAFQKGRSAMRSIVAAALTLCILPAVRSADDEHPFKNSKVGDWVEYKFSGTGGVTGKTKMTITAKSDKEVAYDVEGTFAFMGKEMTAPVQKMKVDLTQPYDAISAANLKAKDVKIDKQGNGKEKLKLGDKEFETKWSKLKATATVNGMDIVSEYKMWFCKDVPVSGLVKMDTKAPGFEGTLELVGSGKGK
jgi:hypothetical protein